jgi:hypothetical protein
LLALYEENVNYSTEIANTISENRKFINEVMDDLMTQQDSLMAKIDEGW